MAFYKEPKAKTVFVISLNLEIAQCPFWLAQTPAYIQQMT